MLSQVTNRETLDAVGELVVERIRERTRGGSGAKTPGGNASALKPLSPSYVKQRARDPNLSPETSPSTSNLTRYGDMLDSLYYAIRQGKVFVSVEGADNLRKAIYTSVDRPWANLTRADVTAVRDLVSKLSGEVVKKL